jgi:hypothetical protein
MSKNLRGIGVPGGVARSFCGGISNMETIKDVQKAFHKAVIEGEKLLRQGKITWDQYAFVMLGFEAKLRSMGVVL